jgi:uncharacterized protein (DUF433 family)
MDSLLARITIDPVVCHDKPCIRGLRYAVETLLELLSSGMTIDEILADYEDLERDDILAVLAIAARSVHLSPPIPPCRLRRRYGESDYGGSGDPR